MKKADIVFSPKNPYFMQCKCSRRSSNRNSQKEYIIYGDMTVTFAIFILYELRLTKRLRLPRSPGDSENKFFSQFHQAKVFGIGRNIPNLPEKTMVLSWKHDEIWDRALFFSGRPRVGSVGGSGV